MRRSLDLMAKHTLQTEAGREADKAFHAALLSASDNAFIISLTNSVTAAVAALTEFKQRAAPLRRDPVPDHERVYEAVAAKDAEGGSRAHGRAYPARDSGYADRSAAQIQKAQRANAARLSDCDIV